MEHDSYKVYKEYTANVPEYTVDELVSVEDMLSYTLSGLNKVLGLEVKGEDNE